MGPSEKPEDNMPNDQPVEGVQSNTNVTAPEPVTAESVASEAPVTTSFTTKKSKKGLIIGILAAVLVLLIGGTIGALVWWTSPQNSLDRAMSKISPNQSGSVKGEFDVDSENGGKAKVGYDVKYVDGKAFANLNMSLGSTAMSIDLKGAAALDKDGNLYIKLNDVREVLSAFGPYGSSIEMLYGDIITKIDNKWVHVTADDIKEMSKSEDNSLAAENNMSCYVEALQKITKSSDFSKTMSKAYNENKFAKIEKVVGSEKINGRDSNHMVIEIDEDKFSSYGKALGDSAAFDELKKCGEGSKDSTTDSKSSSKKSETKPTIELWIDKWSHNVNKMEISQEEDGSNTVLSTTFDYSKPEVSMPKADVQFKELMKDFEAAQAKLEQMMSQQYAYDYSY